MLGVSLDRVHTKKQSIEKVMAALQRSRYLHIVSLNPENIMRAQTNPELMTSFNTADIQIIDGAGLYLAAHWTGELKEGTERVTGVDLMTELVGRLLATWSIRPITIAFIGGRSGVAGQTADHFLRLRRDISPHDSVHLTSIPDLDADDPSLALKLSQSQIDLAFFAFGCPRQELWIEAHRNLLSHTVCMGVGGAFDFIAGRVPRAPAWMQDHGLEWLHRLIHEPHRWRRQTALLRFIWLALTQRSRIVWGKGRKSAT